MLVALLALLAFTPQAGATEYEDEDTVVGCVAHDDDDSCSEDDDESESDDDDESESDDDESESDDDESDDDESESDESKDESEHTGSDGAKSCEDGPVARGANGSEHGEQFEDGCLPQFVRRFITRVWKFVGEVDYYEEGVLSMTLGRILNLPRKWRTQDDELLDSDTTVLVSERVRVFQDGARVPRAELDNANDARVHGKLLRPLKWHVDEDGEQVPTIRAKKVYITG
jgi:hypothetical protein